VQLDIIHEHSGGAEMADDKDSVRVGALEVKLAGLEGTVLTELRHLSRDVKNILTAQAMLATKEELSDQEKRIEKLEANQTWATRLIVAGWIAGAGVVSFGKSLFR
jgi:hypothetical protein